MIEFVMPTCEELVEQLHGLRRDVLAIVGDEDKRRTAAVKKRFERMIARYED